MSLISTIPELKKYISIDANSKMITFQTYLDQAEKLYIISLLGKDFYTELHTLYQASMVPSGTPLDADNTALLPYIQQCLAYYMQSIAIPKLSVSFGDLGLMENRSQDGNAAPRWKIERLQVESLKDGDTYAEMLLAFLEENASDSKYATWYQSDANTINSGNIIYNTAILSKYVNVSNSRRIYLSMRNTLRDLEKKYVPKLVGADQYDELIEQLQSATLTDLNRNLLDLIEPIISKRALYMRLPFMRVSIQSEGLWLYSDGNSELRDRWFLADDKEVKAIMCELKDNDLTGFIANEYELRQFIIDNIEDYPNIKASGAYTVQPVPGPTWTTLNDRDNKHFGV